MYVVLTKVNNGRPSGYSGRNLLSIYWNWPTLINSLFLALVSTNIIKLYYHFQYEYNRCNYFERAKPNIIDLLDEDNLCLLRKGHQYKWSLRSFQRKFPILSYAKSKICLVRPVCSSIPVSSNFISSYHILR